MGDTPLACTRLRSMSAVCPGVIWPRSEHSSEWWGSLGRHTTKFFSPVLKVCHVRLTPLVGDGVVTAPLGGDPPEVAAGVLSLGVVAHVGGCGRTIRSGTA